MSYSQNYAIDNSLCFRDEGWEQGCERGHPRASWDLDVFDRYEQGKLHIILHVGLRGSDGKRNDFCAVVNRCKSPLAVGTSDLWRTKCDLPTAQVLKGNIQQPMLVGIVKGFQDGEFGGLVYIPSVVRLRAFDEALPVEADLVNEPNVFSKLIGDFKDRKLEPLGVLQSAARMPNGGSIDNVIEGGSDVVNSIASYEGPSLNVGGIAYSDNHAVAATVSVMLLLDGIRVCVLPREMFGLESIEVFLSPCELAA